MSRHWKFVLIGCVVLGSAGCATERVSAPAASAGMVPAAARPESKDLADVQKALNERQGKRALLVLDIDDTLLTSATFFGSDAWYEWQSRTLQDGDPRRVPCRFDVIAINTEIGTQKPTQQDAPTIINALVDANDSIVLTSRNTGARVATLRELREAKYMLPRPLAGSPDGIAYRFQKDPASKAVTVTYDQGVFMTEGQDKGLVLLNLLDRLNLKYERIVLVDDGARNHENMEKALSSRGIEFRGVFYTLVNKEVDSREEAEAIAGWKALMGTIETVYPERAKRLRAGQCAS